MLKRFWKAPLGALLTMLLIGAPAACKRQANADADGEIHLPAITTVDPNAVPPAIDFPQQLKTDDVAVNEFIRKALESCQTGDYDTFRQLFGVTTEVPEAPQFNRVWRGVKHIRVAGTYKAQRPQQQPEYYVHLVVQLRQPDHYDRTERQAVIWVFHEGDQWRMAPAPSEIQGRILYPNTQPSDGGRTATRPSRRHATSRPEAGTTSPAR
jgi:hypothetical protein